jgi:hypothetical protein
VEVRDTRYLGNPKYVYCVEIAEKPFVQAVFPIAVERGTTQKAALIGEHLGGTRTAMLTAAADEPLGWKRATFETESGLSNPVSVLVSEFPQVVATGANTSFETALPLTLPVGVNGRFVDGAELAVASGGDAVGDASGEETATANAPSESRATGQASSAPSGGHVYSFQAKMGRYYLFEVLANRVGLPLDSLLEIYDADGKKLAEADDDLLSKDSKIYFQAPADGTFYILVRDLLARSGERFVYHLRAEPSGPDFEVHGEYYYAQLAPGTRMLWFARINRLNGFDGPVEIQVEGLPAGVTCTPLTIPPGMSHGALILSAAPDAQIGASLVRVTGKAQLPVLDGDATDSADDAGPALREVVRSGRVTCELQSQGGGQGRWPIHTQLVGVTDPLDLLKVEATPSEITLKPGEKAEIKLKIERNAGFTDPVTVGMAFDYFSTVFGAQLPPGVTLAPGSTALLGKGTAEGKLILQAETGAKKPPPVERLPVAVLVRVSISFSITTNYASNPIHLTIPAEAK